jgi:phage tail P2-like protein
MGEVILASAIANVPHLAAFDLTAEKRFGGMQLDKLLIYIIDTVDASALPWLAKQFNVLGYRGMKLAKSEAEQREVIKNAILLKRYAGTLYAVKQAIRAVGYTDAVVVENTGTGPHGWAYFTILMTLGNNGITEEKTSELIQMINIYKGTRNHLTALTYSISFDDSIIVLDESGESTSLSETDVIVAGGDFRHNGVYRRNGTKNYSSDSDVLEFEIITA